MAIALQLKAWQGRNGASHPRQQDTMPHYILRSTKILIENIYV